MSVVQVMMAEVDVILVAVTALKVIGAAPVVVKVESADVVVTPEEFVVDTMK